MDSSTAAASAAEEFGRGARSFARPRHFVKAATGITADRCADGFIETLEVSPFVGRVPATGRFQAAANFAILLLSIAPTRRTRRDA